jgi:hypothetical protein
MRSSPPWSFGTLASAVFVGSLALACDPSANEEVLRLIDDVITIGNDNVAIVCDCWDEAGFASRSACLEDQILPSQRRCVEDAYLREPDASELFLSCVTPILRELGECLDARLSCDAPDGTNACFSDYELGRESCVEVPRSVERALEDCGVDAGGGSGPPAGPGGSDDSVGVPETTATTTEGDDTDGQSTDPTTAESTDPSTAEESTDPVPPDGPPSEDGSTTEPFPEDPSETSGPAPPCPYAGDGECDEPEGTDVCAEGSDPADC